MPAAVDQPHSHKHKRALTALSDMGHQGDQTRSARRYVSMAAAVAAVGGLLFGYDTGIIASALIFVTKTFSLSTAGQEWVAASLNIGAVFGALLSGPVSDRWGRRPAIMVAAGIFIAASVGCGLAPNVSTLIAARLWLGAAIGATTQIVPVYVAELAPASRRGGLVSLFQLVFSLGLLLAFLVGYELSGGAGAWRAMFMLGAIPAMLLGLGMFFLPESPRWLLHHEHEPRAVSILYKLRGHKDLVRQELDDVLTVDHKKQTGSTGSDLKQRWVRPALIAALGVAAFSQLSGPNVIVYYAPIILSQAGLVHSAALLTSVSVGVTSTITTAMGIALIDKVGRRRMMLAMLPMAALSLFLLGAVFLSSAPLTGGRLILMVASLLGYIFFNFGSLSVAVWLIAAEVFPLCIRSKAMGLASATVWLSDTLVSLVTLSLVEALGTTGTFWLFGFINVAAFVFVWKYVPETAGTTLEEIEGALRSGTFYTNIGQQAANNRKS
ncbi:sugar transporter [Acetobacter aceti NRIC 0242]|uniref:MFS transporter n=1 Tax=Acetobacter aceti NBRC 14818 TaxID=887700 RepID=A0AB33ID84_ACEAC|nr:sugar porter family MFS transporter [Acetobacter aceti]TCS35354.1 sugar porter (SP) family MFS transporter [Acetobacter aceti NBRC 14818]BCK75258.1 MFS transporter [Acetobacter aceti NBRC 14818]GAN57452.1 major facilitator superfamily sugar transporter [Acetobacter aceti NBRC 14818]GBO79444.1 sugar transporter [Acetobacter aceti NRIC 0242]